MFGMFHIYCQTTYFLNVSVCFTTKSTVASLVECLDAQTDIKYLDYSKYCDSVVHIKLMYKLESYDFASSAYNWIDFFLFWWNISST